MKMRYLGYFVVNIFFLALFVRCSHKTSSQTGDNHPIPVKVQTVVVERLTEPKNYVGTIVETQSISLSFLTSGSVAEVFVSEGQHVKKNQVLAVLHSENHKSVLDAATAKAKQAQDAYDRLSSVYKNGSLPMIKMVEAETNLQQAKSSQQISEKSLHDCTLYSPTDGVIGKRLVEPGMNVVQEIPVFTIVKIEKVFAKISVSESEISHITIGQDAAVWISALDNKSVNGKVKEKGVIADPLSRTYMVKIIISNEQNNISPGMACSVQLNTNRVESKIVVPQYAVQKGTDGSYVYVIDESKTKAIKRIVHVGSLLKNGVVIIDGLRGGEDLVVEGFQKLSANTPIVIQ